MLCSSKHTTIRIKQLPLADKAHCLLPFKVPPNSLAFYLPQRQQTLPDNMQKVSTFLSFKPASGKMLMHQCCLALGRQAECRTAFLEHHLLCLCFPGPALWSASCTCYGFSDRAHNHYAAGILLSFVCAVSSTTGPSATGIGGNH